MKQRDFVFNLCLLIFLNLLVKPVWLLGVDVGVQNRVGAESYGLYFSILSFTMLFNMLLDMGTTNYNNRNIARNPDKLDEQLSGYVMLRFALGMIYFIAVFVVALLIGYRDYQLKLLFWIALNQFLSAFLLYVRSNISALMMFKTDSIISVLDKLLMIFFCGVLLWGNVADQQFRIEWFIWSQTIAYVIAIVVAMFVVLKNAKLKPLNINILHFIDIIKVSFPYALVTLLMSCYYRIDSVMLERLLPENIAAGQAGIYASAFRLLDTLVIVAYLFSVILLPLFSKMLKNKDDVTAIVKTSFSLLSLYSISAVVILYVFRTPVIEILYDTHVEESVAVFRLIVFGLVPISFTYLFGTLLTANGNMKLLNITALVGILINITANAILIPKIHAEGSAIASFCTQFTVSLLQFLIAMRIIGISYKSLPIVRTLLFVVLLVPATVLIHRYLHFNLIVNLVISAAVALAIGFVTGLVDIKSLVDLTREGAKNKLK